MQPALFSCHESSGLSVGECQYLGTLIQNSPNQKIFLPDGTLHHILYKGSEGYLAQGAQIGQGFWGKVYSASLYKNLPMALSERRVIKIAYSSNWFGDFLNSVSNLRSRMIEEARLVKQLYRVGEFLEVEEPNSTKTTMMIVMPDLGSPLAKLLQDVEVTKTMPLQFWLIRIVNLVDQVRKFHTRTDRIHNDIKPGNIGFSSQDGDLNIYDLGNAHPPNTIALLGDRNYQPPEVYTFIPSLRTVKVDVFTLGKSLFEVLQHIQGHYEHPADKATLLACTKLFDKMIAALPQDRPDISNVCNELFEVLIRHNKKINVFIELVEAINAHDNKMVE